MTFRTIRVWPASLLGKRPTNEDVEIKKLNLTDTGEAADHNLCPSDIFIICDGHGGNEVAKIAAPMLLKYLTVKRRLPYSDDYINKVYNYIQEKIAEYPVSLECGSTALVVIRYYNNKQHRLQVINLGDGRAVLARNRWPLQLTMDHKPVYPDEHSRIEQVNEETGQNHHIHYDAGDWRIHDLSVSRAFGDVNAKPHVTHLPQIFHYVLENRDKILILACDGLWDVLSNSEAIDFVLDNISTPNTKKYNSRNYPFDSIGNKNIAKRLADYAINGRGSTDNVSVFVIAFN